MAEQINKKVTKISHLRLVIEPQARKRFFDEIRDKDNSVRSAALLLGVSTKTLRNWSTGIHLPSLEAITLLSKEFGVKQPEVKMYIDEYLQKSAAATLGAHARNKKHGNPGTTVGRQIGGARAIASLSVKTGHKFVLAHQITEPQRSEELSELIGIVLGDGYLGNYQLRVSLSNVSDKDYSVYVGNLVERLFSITPSYYVRRDDNTVTVVVSSVNVIKFLQSCGLTIGHKLNNKVDIPRWVTEEAAYSKQCLRGLFDTDGCVYLDKHNYKGRIYYNLGLSFSSSSENLLISYGMGLKKLGLHPTFSSRNSVVLRRANEIKIFFDVVGTSNPKHRKRYTEFLRLRGEVA